MVDIRNVVEQCAAILIDRHIAICAAPEAAGRCRSAPATIAPAGAALKHEISKFAIEPEEFRWEYDRTTYRQNKKHSYKAQEENLPRIIVE